MAQEDQRPLAEHRPEEGGHPFGRGRMQVGEQTLAVGPALPGGALEQVRLGPGRVVGQPGDRVRGDRLRGQEHVALAGPQQPVVEDSGRQRRGEPDREGQQGAGQDLVGAAVVLEGVGSADDHPMRHLAIPGHGQPGGPGSTEEHRHQPVRRQVEQHRVARIAAELVGQQVRGLADPVDVRRHRQLGPLAGDVVVRRDEGLGRVGVQPSGEKLGEGAGGSHPRHGSRESWPGEWQDARHDFFEFRRPVGSRAGRRGRHPPVAALACVATEVPARPDRQRAHPDPGDRGPAHTTRGPTGRGRHGCRARGRRTPAAARGRPRDRRAVAA